MSRTEFYWYNYFGESARRISEWIIDDGGSDQKSRLFRHVVVNDHRNASYNYFKIIGSGFRNNTFKRKIVKALLIKELQQNFGHSGEIGWPETVELVLVAFAYFKLPHTPEMEL